MGHSLSAMLEMTSHVSKKFLFILRIANTNDFSGDNKPRDWPTDVELCLLCICWTVSCNSVTIYNKWNFT